MRYKQLFILLIFLAAFSMVFGQSPELFNYQAVARHSDGSVIMNSSISIRISILEGSASGDVLYIETHHVITSDYGLFTLSIGGGESIDDFSSINWGSGNQKWIQIELDASGGDSYIMMGTSQLLSVPYALYAKQALNITESMKSYTNEERNNISDPVPGMMIFNTSTNCINIYKPDGWWEICGDIISTSFQCGDLMTDSRDGKQYPTVQIGNKCWMAKNLDVGQHISGAGQQTDNEIIEKYCYDNNANACNTYGGLYQWNELMNYSTTEGTQGICPEGWHVPGDQEWQEMEIALGMSSDEAERLNVWRGTDEGTQLGNEGSSGYDALYSGRSVPGGLFTAIGAYEYIWTSTESMGSAWRRCLSVNDPKIGRWNTFPKSYGMSVRCVRD